MKSNKRKEVSRDPDLGTQPARPFKGVIITGLLLAVLFIVYSFWNAEQSKKAEERKKEQLRIAEQRLIEKIQKEEREQLIVDTLRDAQVALKDTRWDAAEANVQNVLKLDKENKAAQELLKKIYQERLELDIIREKTALIDALGKEDLKIAVASLKKIRQLDATHHEIKGLAARINRLKQKIVQRQSEASLLYKQALALDKGTYSEDAISLLKKAQKLHPESTEIQQLYTKISNYTSELHVPEDYASIRDALEVARPRDLINIAAGVYKEAITIHKTIKLKGALGGKTVIECSGAESSVITIAEAAAGTTLSGLVMKHTGFDYGEQRFSAITCQARDVMISACTVERALGHGIAVIDNAQATISFCKIIDSGWDGISVYGQGSQAKIKESLCENSMQHGIQFWDGGSGSVTKSFAIGNGLCGISVASSNTQTQISTTKCRKNREAGILISAGASADLKSNQCHENLLSGIVARGSGTVLNMVSNITKKNQQAGILIHKSVKVKSFDGNISKGNVTHQIAKGSK